MSKQSIYYLSLLYNYHFLIFAIALLLASSIHCQVYISGDSFKSFSNFVIDKKNRLINLKRIKRKSVIFVKTDFLGHFFSKIHRRIKHPYILVTHNSDIETPGKYSRYLNDKKLIAWFGQNPSLTHSKFHILPIGIANKQWPHGNVLIFDEVRTHLQQNPPQKTILLYMNFAPTHPERSIVYNLFINKKFCSFSLPKDLRSYLLEVAQSKFVLCPRGNGLDTHRLWETLLMGSFPIVKSSPMDPILSDLPVLIVNQWKSITEDFLNTQYEQLKNKPANYNKLFINYWEHKIQHLLRNKK